MHRRLQNTLFLCAWFAACASVSFAGENGRFSLLFKASERVGFDTLGPWPIPGSRDLAKVQGKNVFDADSPVRLIRDHSAKLERRAPLVMLANGDVLNGLPRQLAPSDGRQGQPQRVRVQLDSPLMPIDGVGVNVRTDRVQRIVGQDSRLRKPPPAPGTVLLMDGRELKGTSIRWQEYGLAILTADGIVQAAFSELADAVFHVDQMTAVLGDSLSAGSLDGPAIMRLALRSGAVLTTSRASREVERSRNRGKSTVEVMYYLQPAWCSNPIAIPETEIAWIGYRRTDEVPLSLLPATTHANTRFIGEAQNWLRNSSQGGPLVSVSNDESDLGLATHSDSQIVFALPPGAVSLSTIVGLDRVSGDGGCVQCRIATWDAATKKPSQTLWDSGVFTGSSAPKATGSIDVQSLASVVLITENAHDNRPAGADPLDIRDDVCWLSPLVVVSPIARSQSPALARALPGLDSWDEFNNEWNKVKVGNRWNEAADRWEAVLTIPAGANLQVRRTETIQSSGDVLEIVSAISQNFNEQDLELKVNGEVVPWNTSEDRASMATRHRKYVEPWKQRNNRFSEMREDMMSDTLAYWFDLQKYHDLEVTLELTIRGGRGYSLVWADSSLRSAIGNLPVTGELPKVDVRLTDLPITEASEVRGRGEAIKDMLPYTIKYREPIRFLGQVRTGGYGMIRNTFYAVDLKPEYKKFVAVVGGVKLSSGPMRVMVDGQVLWEKNRVNALAPAELIELPLPTGGKRLTLICGADGSYDSAAAWSDAGFVK